MRNVAYRSLASPLATSADALDKLVEIVLAEPFIQFQPLVIENKALDNELPQRLSCLNAELGSLGAIDAIAYGNDGVEVVEVDRISFTIGGSCPEFPENCLFV